VYVLALEVHLRIPDSHSLKDKRQIVTSVLETSRRRFSVSAAEVGHQESWQRAVLGFAVVASTAGHAEDVIDSVEHHLWSRLGVEVVSAERVWLED
jgi:uncharacterized protein YlxP (DUF503 family)